MMKGAFAVGSLALVACSSGASPTDAAVTQDLSIHDLTMSHCIASTPETILVEGPCAQAPPNGYCFVDVPNPTF